MNAKDIISRIDHTLLLPTATAEDVKKIAKEGVEYKTASICIPPAFVEGIHKIYPDLNICTVIGFPLGYNTSKTKVLEAVDSVESGASEIDMVVNISNIKSNNYEPIEKEIAEIKKSIGSRILKVIIETAYLTEDEKIQMCKVVSNSGADYIKTSTGFAPSGATFDDIKLFKKYVDKNIKIKAAGGMKTYDDMVKFIELGADRLGTSSGLKLVLDKK